MPLATVKIQPAESPANPGRFRSAKHRQLSGDFPLPLIGRAESIAGRRAQQSSGSAIEETPVCARAGRRSQLGLLPRGRVQIERHPQLLRSVASYVTR